MDKIKPWQIVLMVAAVVAVATSAYFSLGGQKTNMATSIRMIDVNTGETVTMGFGKGGATYPGINPKTKTLSLMPIHKADDGKWYIYERYLPALAGIEGSKQAVLDAKTGEVRATD